MGEHILHQIPGPPSIDIPTYGLRWSSWIFSFVWCHVSPPTNTRVQSEISSLHQNTQIKHREAPKPWKQFPSFYPRFAHDFSHHPNTQPKPHFFTSLHITKQTFKSFSRLAVISPWSAGWIPWPPPQPRNLGTGGKRRKRTCHGEVRSSGFFLGGGWECFLAAKLGVELCWRMLNCLKRHILGFNFYS